MLLPHDLVTVKGPTSKYCHTGNPSHSVRFQGMNLVGHGAEIKDTPFRAMQCNCWEVTVPPWTSFLKPLHLDGTTWLTYGWWNWVKGIHASSRWAPTLPHTVLHTLCLCLPGHSNLGGQVLKWQTAYQNHSGSLKGYGEWNHFSMDHELNFAWSVRKK